MVDLESSKIWIRVSKILAYPVPRGVWRSRAIREVQRIPRLKKNYVKMIRTDRGVERSVRKKVLMMMMRVSSASAGMSVLSLNRGLKGREGTWSMM